jgi:hypothetical protein
LNTFEHNLQTINSQQLPPPCVREPKINFPARCRRKTEFSLWPYALPTCTRAAPPIYRNSFSKVLTCGCVNIGLLDAEGSEREVAFGAGGHNACKVYWRVIVFVSQSECFPQRAPGYLATLMMISSFSYIHPARRLTMNIRSAGFISAR